MNIAICTRIVGLLLMVFSAAMLPSLILSWIREDSSTVAFFSALSATLVSGSVLWTLSRGARAELQIRDGFMITALFWIVLGGFGSLPFILIEEGRLPVVDALFESISGLTTTGATVISGLDELPQSILLYRQLLQWLGGIGIIVLAVAILPMLGIGGLQLYRAESTGPSRENKLTPRITSTAKALFAIYLALTTACAVAYYIAGMTAFDALAHALSTVAIGGFSTHDASMGFFNNNAILLISSVFMIISGINFSVHFFFVQRRNFSLYYQDPETNFFVTVIALGVFVTCVTLFITSTFPLEESLVHGLFQTVSIATTTGFTTRDFALWPIFLPTLLIMLSVVGGCVGSTGGGMKAMRVLLIFKQGTRELKQLIHPNAVIPLKLGTRRVQPAVVSAVWSFFAVYMFCFVVIMICMLATGLDFQSSFSAVLATMNNLGPGLGSVADNYASVTDPGKLILCFAMLLGRLEVFTLLLLLTPTFWRT